MKKLFTIMPCLLLVGCMGVPSTTIRYSPKTKTLDLGSPKDVTIKKATVTESNGFFSLAIEGYSAKNNINVIKAVIEGNAKTRAAVEENAAKTVGTLIDLAK